MANDWLQIHGMVNCAFYLHNTKLLEFSLAVWEMYYELHTMGVISHPYPNNKAVWLIHC